MSTESQSQIEQRRQELKQQMQQFHDGVLPSHAEPQEQWAEWLAALEKREASLTAEQSNLQARADHLRAETSQRASEHEELEQRAQEIARRDEEITGRQSQCERDDAELEEQFFQLDEYRAKLLAEARRLGEQKGEQDVQEAHLLQRSLDIE